MIISGNSGETIHQFGNISTKGNVTLHNMNNVFVRSDGTNINKVGSMMSASNGTTVNKVGNIWTTNKGKTYNRVGSMLLCSDGRSWYGVNSEDDVELIIKHDI